MEPFPPTSFEPLTDDIAQLPEGISNHVPEGIFGEPVPNADVWPERDLAAAHAREEFEQYVAGFAEAARTSIFGDTTCWGFCELYEPLPMPSTALAEAHADDLIEAQMDGLIVVAESECLRRVAAVSSLGYRHHGAESSDWPCIDVPEHDVVLVDYRWPREALPSSSTLLRPAPVADNFDDPDLLDPDQPGAGALLGERWRGGIRRALRPHEGHDPAAIRALLSRYIDAARDLHATSGLIGGGIFCGIAPLQRLMPAPSIPYAVHRSTQPWARTMLYPGITQAELDVAMAARQAELDAQDRDPVDEAFDVVAGDYRDQAVSRVRELDTTMLSPWIMRHAYPVGALRELVDSAIALAGTDGSDSFYDGARCANVRELLRTVVDDDVFWRLLSRAELPPKG